jgi:YD repeat-containing protein
MQLNPICQNGSSRKADSAGSPPGGCFHDVWNATGNTRAIIHAGGARTTFVYDAQSRTVIQFPGGGRTTLAWCNSQVTTSAALLSQFAAHVELRSSLSLASTETRAGEFLAHPESQRQITRVATAVVRARWKHPRWLDDVIQQANLHLLNDLRQRKAIFAGDDPDRFSRWFSGTSRHAVVDAIKFCLRAYNGFALSAVDVADPKTVDPAELVMFRELGRLAYAEIGGIRESKVREVMFDLRDGKTIPESAARLGISKSHAGKMRKRGCQLVADRLGK